MLLTPQALGLRTMTEAFENTHNATQGVGSLEIFKPPLSWLLSCCETPPGEAEDSVMKSSLPHNQLSNICSVYRTSAPHFFQHKASLGLYGGPVVPMCRFDPWSKRHCVNSSITRRHNTSQFPAAHPSVFAGPGSSQKHWVSSRVDPLQGAGEQTLPGFTLHSWAVTPDQSRWHGARVAHRAGRQWRLMCVSISSAVELSNSFSATMRG